MKHAKKQLKYTYFISAITVFCQSHNAQAMKVNGSEVEGRIDTFLSYGSLYRLGEQQEKNVNKNDGNENYDQGFVSNTAKITMDAQFNLYNFGSVLRASLLNDFNITHQSNDGFDNYLAGKENNGYQDQFSEEAKSISGRDFQWLDAYIFADVDFGDHAMSIRFGKQVINWGEAFFVRDGINSSNPVDLSKLRVPGAEVKEALLPLHALYFNVNLTQRLSMETYYAFEWQPSRMDPVGTYYSTTDILGAGATRAIADLKNGGDFLVNEGIHESQKLLDGMDSFHAGLEERTQALTNLLGIPSSAATSFLTQDYYGALGDSYAENQYIVQAAGRGDDVEANQTGQYGLAFRYTFENLNSTELGLYFINYHSFTPRLRGNLGQSNFLGAPIAVGNALCPILDDEFNSRPATGEGSQEVARLSCTNFVSGYNGVRYIESAAYQAVYPENIRLYGFSFNTSIGNTSVSGEIAYRPNMPLFTAYEDNLLANNILNAIETKESTEAFASDPSFTGIANGGSLDFSQQPGTELLGTYQAGDTFSLFDRKEVTNASLAFLHNFGPVPAISLDSLMALIELGFSHVSSLTEKDRYRSAEGNYALVEGATKEDYLTNNAWGYTTVFSGTINNLLFGISAAPFLRYSEGVSGNSYRTGSFAEGQKAHTVGIDFIYLQTLKTSFALTQYYGKKEGYYLRDRDNVTLSVQYSF